MDKESASVISKKYLDFVKENNLTVLKAYIFGSYAKGTFHEHSDIDLAIILKDLVDEFDMQVLLMKLRRKIDTRIQPHPFDEKDFIDPCIPLVNEILQTGIRII